MKQKHILLYISLAMIIAACNSTKEKGKETEKIIALPAITKDPGSVYNNLKQKLPYRFRYAANDSMTVEVLENSAKLHLKNDSCWIEYTSNVIVHKKQKDGSEKNVPTMVIEETDTVAVK